MKIGVLAVQGAFIEHEKALAQLGVDCVELRQKKDLAGIDGVVLPGGESTVQGRLLRATEMFEPLQHAINSGMPTLATCAGLILLAQKLQDDATVHLGVAPIVVKRNAYGRQLGSFRTNLNVEGVGEYPAVFIRAPYVADAARDVQVLARCEDKIVAVQFRNQLGLAFHPEMTDDLRIHERFVELVRQA